MTEILAEIHPSKEVFQYPNSMQDQLERDLPGVVLNALPIPNTDISLVAITHINGDPTKIETAVVMSNRVRGISIGITGVDTQITKNPAWGDKDCLVLAEESVDDKDWVKFPKMYANPKYLRQEQVFAVKRAVLEGDKKLLFADRQCYWAELIENIDQLVCDGREGLRLQMLDEIGGLYQLRLVLMGLIKGKKLSELEANFANGTKEIEAYAPSSKYPEKMVDGTWNAPCWYQFADNLVVASGNQVLGLVLHIDDYKNIEILCNWEFSPQAKRYLAILTGGGIKTDESETPQQALLRELLEELGVYLQIAKQMSLNGIYMQHAQWYEPTRLVAALVKRRGDSNEEGDEITHVSAVTSDMKSPSWMNMSTFESEILEGHLMDGRIPASVYLALLNHQTDNWGLKLENPREVIAAMEHEDELAMANVAGSLDSLVEIELRKALGK